VALVVGEVPVRTVTRLLDLGAPVGHGHHALRAALRVTHRPAQAPREGGHRHLLGGGGDPRAEAAADAGVTTRTRSAGRPSISATVSRIRNGAWQGT
jgi:hypothetical protein